MKIALKIEGFFKLDSWNDQEAFLLLKNSQNTSIKKANLLAMIILIETQLRNMLLIICIKNTHLILIVVICNLVVVFFVDFETLNKLLIMVLECDELFDKHRLFLQMYFSYLIFVHKKQVLIYKMKTVMQRRGADSSCAVELVC